MKVNELKNVIVSLLKLHGDPVLAGRLDGRRTFRRALEDLPTIDTPTVVVLNFGGIELATSSFLSETVLPLREHLRLRRPPGFVVVANLSERVKEEFDELLNRSGDAVLGCQLSATGHLSEAAILGRLEPKLRKTLDLLIQKGEATAVELHIESGESQKVGATAFNNRLTTLASKSLLMEIPQGRAKKFRPILELA